MQSRPDDFTVEVTCPHGERFHMVWDELGYLRKPPGRVCDAHKNAQDPNMRASRFRIWRETRRARKTLERGKPPWLSS